MAKVKIQGHASGTGVLTVTAPNTSTDRTITLPDSTGTLATTADAGVAGISSSADATAITIDSSERVGIGAAPASGVAMTITKDGTGADMAGIRFIDSNSGNAQQIYNYQGNLYFRDATAGVTRIRVDSDGLKFNNDSAAANALDDYEEGNWTPTLTGSGTISHRVGKYVKIGNQIMIQGEIRSTSYNNSGATDVQIGGLPYSSYNQSNYNFAANITPISGFNLSSDHGIVGYMSPNQSHINLFGLNQSAGANYDFLQQGEMGTTVEVFFAVHYRTN